MIGMGLPREATPETPIETPTFHAHTTSGVIHRIPRTDKSFTDPVSPAPSWPILSTPLCKHALVRSINPPTNQLSQRPPPPPPTFQNARKPQRHNHSRPQPRRRAPLLRRRRPNSKTLPKIRPRLPLLRLQPRRLLLPLAMVERLRPTHRPRRRRRPNPQR